MHKLYFMSVGIHTPLGRSLLSSQLSLEKVQNKKILLIAGEHDWLAPYLVNACVSIGFSKENVCVIHEGQKKAVMRLFLTYYYDYIYVTEGNTFRMLQFIREHDLVNAIKEQVRNGASYIGVSAGAHIAGKDIKTALPFDSNGVVLMDYEGLSLFDGVVVPHFNAMDRKRFETYKEAKQSGIYKNVYTVREDEIVVVEVTND